MSENSNKNLKIAVIILALLLLGSIGYIVKLTSDLKTETTTVENLTTEKDEVIANLEALKRTYDEAIAENSALKDELEAERGKVVQLLQEVKQSNSTVANLSVFKKRYQELEVKFNALIKENELLKEQNQNLTQAIDSTNVVLIEEREYSKTLLGQNEELSKIVDEASKLSIQNLTTAAYKVKSSGREVATEKARRADILKIEFTIAENKVAKSGTRVYHVQVIDGKNNVLGDRKTLQFGDKSLTYSFDANVEYNNSTVKVSENLKGDNFEKGLYHVHVFDGEKLMASQSFTLK